MGFSDMTILHTFINIQGVTSFYGPSIIAVFSQMEHLPLSFKQHVHHMLFEPRGERIYTFYNQYCDDGYPDWGIQKILGKQIVKKMMM